MDVDKELNKICLKRVTNFKYNVGDYFFDAMAYLLKYSITSTSI
jgi:hypothetical protein